MKRVELIRHLTVHGAEFLREGRRHTIMGKGRMRSEVPRHTDIV